MRVSGSDSCSNALRTIRSSVFPFRVAHAALRDPGEAVDGRAVSAIVVIWKWHGESNFGGNRFETFPAVVRSPKDAPRRMTIARGQNMEVSSIGNFNPPHSK